MTFLIGQMKGTLKCYLRFVHPLRFRQTLINQIILRGRNIGFDCEEAALKLEHKVMFFVC